MVYHIGGGGGFVVTDIVDGAGPRPPDRGHQHIRDVLNMNARERLPRLVDAPCGAGTQRVERAAPRAVNPGEAEHLHRDAATAPQIEPSGFGGNATPTPHAARLQRRALVHPAAVAIAVDAGGRKITEPCQAADRGDVLAMP